jgi:hypothetical protein
MPQYTNNYEFEAMDLDGDNFLDLVTINDGDIVDERGSSRREHVFRNDGRGRFRDATTLWWAPAHNVGEDDNMVAFLDYDSDGDADFVIGSLTGPDRLLINDGEGHLTMADAVFEGADTPGTLGLALADLDGDGRMDVVQAQGEHPTAVGEKVFLGRGLTPDTAPSRNWAWKRTNAAMSNATPNTRLPWKAFFPRATCGAANLWWYGPFPKAANARATWTRSCLPEPRAWRPRIIRFARP